MILSLNENNGFNNSMFRLRFVMFIVMIMMMIVSSANGDDLSLLSSSLTTGGIPTDSETSSDTSDISYDSSNEMSKEDEIRSVNENVGDDIGTTTSSMVLKPNISGALDVGHGLLVPLVPVPDPNNQSNSPKASPLVAHLVPVSVENVTATNPDEDFTSVPEVNDNDMDPAEDIVFRPLFKYRQEVEARRQSFNRNRYYQPYIYAYKPSRQSNYDNNDYQRRLYYNSRDNYN